MGPETGPGQQSTPVDDPMNRPPHRVPTLNEENAMSAQHFLWGDGWYEPARPPVAVCTDGFRNCDLGS